MVPQGESVAGVVGEVVGEGLTERKDSRELEFTGNWFIDAGILGFVNLMRLENLFRICVDMERSLKC